MLEGAYTAERTAALAGVPWSTVHFWAREGIVVPSISPVRVKLWSYTDLLALRTVHWLRHDKVTRDGTPIPGTSMRKVKAALKQLRKLDADLFDSQHRSAICVDPSGEVLLAPEQHPAQWLNGQLVFDGAIDVVAPFQSAESVVGPDLVAPRPWVRIHPQRLSGATHVLGTRIETEALFRLQQRGFDEDRVVWLYPEIRPEALDDAIRLEQQLDRNRRAAA